MGIVQFDRQRHPFDIWLKHQLRECGWLVDDPQQLHQVLPAQSVQEIARSLTAATGRPPFRAMLRSFVREVLQPRLPGLLALQRFVNIRIHPPDRPDLNVPFHTDAWYGHGPGERNVWLPVCGARHTAGLQVLQLATSRRLTELAIRRCLSLAEMQQLFLRHGRPVHLRAGEALLFTGEHLHGSVTNETGMTRVSLDFRLVRSGTRLGRKSIGGYFELLDEGDPGPARDPGARRPREPARACVSYVGIGTPHCRSIPTHLQRLMIREFARDRGLTVAIEHLEIAPMSHLPTLMHLLGSDSGPAAEADAVILFSIHSLPTQPGLRRQVYSASAARGTTLYFANEGEQIDTPADCERIERLLRFAGLSEAAPQ